MLDMPTHEERRAVVAAQVRDAADGAGWVYLFMFARGHYIYMPVGDAVEIVRTNAGCLADSPTPVALEVFQ